MPVELISVSFSEESVTDLLLKHSHHITSRDVLDMSY